jgi:hypothetical protein
MGQTDTSWNNMKKLWRGGRQGDEIINFNAELVS